MPLYLKFYFWFLVVSALVFAVERIFSSVPKQPVFRAGFEQDLFWMVFNSQYASWMLAILGVHVVAWIDMTFLHWGLPRPDAVGLISGWPWALQFGVFFIIKDFLEWNIHRTLHRVPWLWELHKLHHSSERLDWLAAFRSHWGEIVIYKVVIFMPLVVLGVNSGVIFAILVLSLLIQELVHANLPWDFGRFRYLVNSPRLHAWHHTVEMHGRGGQNFGISLAVWDWLFGTVYMPGDGRPPARMGFDGLEQYPAGWWGRLWSPFVRWSKPGRRPGDGP